MKALLVLALGFGSFSTAYSQVSESNSVPQSHLKQIESPATGMPADDGAVVKPFVSDKKAFTMEPVGNGSEATETKPAVTDKRDQNPNSLPAEGESRARNQRVKPSSTPNNDYKIR